MSARDGLGQVPAQAVVGAKYATAASAAARALKIGSRFGRVVLAPLGTGASDVEREAAVIVACGTKYRYERMPGTWYGPNATVVYPTPSAADAIVAYTPANPGASGILTLPSWMSYQCATAGRTTQLDAATVVSGLGANVAPWRSVDGSVGGLSVPCAVTNSDTGPHDVFSWPVYGAASMSDHNGQAAPDGTMTASAANWTTTTGKVGSVYDNVPTDVAALVTIWMLKKSGTVIDVWENHHDYTEFLAQALPLTWTRKSFALTAHPGNTQWLVMGDYTNAAAGAVWLWNQNIVTGAKYPRPDYPVSNSSCAAAKLAATATILSPLGWWDNEIVVRPHYAYNETTADHDIWYLDANNRLYYQQSTAKMRLLVAGNEVLSTALTFSREQAITIRHWNKPTGKGLIVSGATTGNGSAVGSIECAATLPASIYLLSSSTAAQECASLCGLITRSAF